MKTVPPCACHAVSNRAERGIMLALVLKAASQDCHSKDLALIDTLEDRTSRRQSRIAIWNFSMALDLAPEYPKVSATAQKHYARHDCQGGEHPRWMG